LLLSCGKTKNNPSHFCKKWVVIQSPFEGCFCLMFTRNLGLSFKIIYPLVL
jgi:hypothetical protein